MLSGKNKTRSKNSNRIGVAAVLLVGLCCGRAYAETTQVVVNRDGSTIALEPYAPNIVRVTLSKSQEQATACAWIWVHCLALNTGLDARRQRLRNHIQVLPPCGVGRSSAFG